MRPTIVLVGADKGGVGKTTLSRALLDYLGRKNVLARAFDTEHPRGTLRRFYPAITEVVDFTNVADQMKVLDTLDTANVRVTLVDLRAGNLILTLDMLDRIGALEAARNGQFDIGLFHVIGPAIASLDEIAEIASYVNGIDYIIARNFINETNFFEWDQQTHKKYFARQSTGNQFDIPRLNEMAYEQVDLANVTFKDFVDNRNGDGTPAKFSFVLRGYVRKWCNDLYSELDGLNLLQELTTGRPLAEQSAA
ncbi:MAG: hypothetical protein ACJ8AS_12655 [Hyphomicrobiales bacterium]